MYREIPDWSRLFFLDQTTPFLHYEFFENSGHVCVDSIFCEIIRIARSKPRVESPMGPKDLE